MLDKVFFLEVVGKVMLGAEEDYTIEGDLSFVERL